MEAEECEVCRGAPPQFYCPECEKVFCTECAQRCHNTPATMLHSGEPIMDASNSVAAITPFGGHLLVAFLAWTLWNDLSIGPKYMHRLTCPLIDRSWRVVTSIDTGLYAQFKPSFMGWCDTEDSFWKFLQDAWVRCVVARSDSWFLLVTQLHALMGGVVLVAAVCVPLAVVSGIVLAAVYGVERQLGKINGYLCVARYFRAVAHAVSVPFRHYAAICSLLTFGIVKSESDRKLPPLTGKRIRQSVDFVDSINYRVSRALRKYHYFKAESLRCLLLVVTTAVASALCVRVLCLMVPDASEWIRSCAELAGLGKLISSHQEVFGTSRKAEPVTALVEILWRSTKLGKIDMPFQIAAGAAIVGVSLLGAQQVRGWQRSRFLKTAGAQHQPWCEATE